MSIVDILMLGLGMDMIYAWLVHFYGADVIDRMFNQLEYAPHTDPDWDPFSIVHDVSAMFLHHASDLFMIDIIVFDTILTYLDTGSWRHSRWAVGELCWSGWILDLAAIGSL